MIPEQIFQLKITSAQLAAGNLDTAKQLYAWFTEEAAAAEAARQSKLDAQRELAAQQLAKVAE